MLAAYDRLFGLELEHLAVDGCIIKGPCGGQVAGPSAVDRRKQGLKRSVATEAGGIPLAAVPASANHRDDGLLAATLDAIGVIGPLLERARGAPGCRLQLPALPGDAGRAGTAGRDRHAWQAHASAGWPPVGDRAHPCLGNQYGKLRWCTERRRLVVEFWLALVNAAIVLGRLVRRAWTHYRWDSRLRRRP